MHSVLGIWKDVDGNILADELIDKKKCHPDSPGKFSDKSVSGCKSLSLQTHRSDF